MQEIRFDHDVETGQRLLIERLKADPRPAMVFSFDLQSSTAASRSNDQILSDRPFVMAGYSSDEIQINKAQIGDFAAMAEYSLPRMLRTAINTAAVATRGQDLPGRIEIHVDVTESSPRASLAVSAALEKAQLQKELDSREKRRQRVLEMQRPQP